MADRRATVPILEADPDLAEALPADALDTARRHAIAGVVSLEPGPWEAPSRGHDVEGHLGLLILEGLLTRNVQLGETSCTELLGTGDVLRPWDEDGEEAVVPFDVVWQVTTPTRLAVLDRRFARVVGHWPELTAAIVSRTVRRSRSLSVHLAICHIQRVDERLLALFWHLADRWGRVERDGVVVPLRFTHQTLARLAGAQRPSVTTSLRRLAERGDLKRRDDGFWILRARPPATHPPASDAATGEARIPGDR